MHASARTLDVCSNCPAVAQERNFVKVARSPQRLCCVLPMGSVGADYKCPLCGRVSNGGYAPDGIGYPICTGVNEPHKQPDCLSLLLDSTGTMMPSHIVLVATGRALQKVLCNYLKFSTDDRQTIVMNIVPWLIDLASFDRPRFNIERNQQIGADSTSSETNKSSEPSESTKRMRRLRTPSSTDESEYESESSHSTLE